MSYVTPKEASEKYKVSRETVRRWALKGKIKYKVTEGGHRRYLLEEKEPEIKREKIVYGRVSSKKQEPNLSNQLEVLKKRYPESSIISDIGSGINFKRPGFRKILDGVFNKTIGEVVVTYPDRFSRFGFELFQWIFESHGAKLISIKTGDEKSLEQELAEDLLSIITVFSSKYYGKRDYRKLLQENTNLPQFSAEKSI